MGATLTNPLVGGADACDCDCVYYVCGADKIVVYENSDTSQVAIHRSFLGAASAFLLTP